MLLVLKIPMIYLGAVVFWAVRAQPEPDGGGEEAEALVPLVPCGWEEWKRRRLSRGRGRPMRPLAAARHRARAKVAA